ncbi:MAG: triose-phosphate isomerase [bacterium]|nr:triose-phosphate isomerase [bacterium]
MNMERIVIANWKMNPSRIKDALKLFKTTHTATRACKNTTVMVAAPAPFLPLLAKLPGKQVVSLAAQDLSHQGGGAYTGEVGGSMLASIGASHVLVGHSERRLQGEDDECVARKMLSAHKARLVPILCVGESQRDADGAYLRTVGDQVVQALQYLTASHIAKSMIAYEPIWAIGAQAAQTRDVEEMCLYIRRSLSDRVGPNRAARIPILYGGSVEVRNAASFIEETGVQGLLVGRASLHASFGSLLKKVDQVSFET